MKISKIFIWFVLMAVMLFLIVGCSEAFRKSDKPERIETTLSSASLNEQTTATKKIETTVSSVSLNEQTTTPKTTEISVIDRETSTIKPTDATKASTTVTIKNTESTAISTSAVTSKSGVGDYTYAGLNPGLAVIDEDNWNLLLVNRHLMLPADFTVDLTYVVNGNQARLDSRVAAHYTSMYNAAKEDGLTLVPISGHRRISTQKTNFENKISEYMSQGYSKVTATQKAAQIILPPGCSEHNAGLAMDICSLDTNFENSKEFQWLMKNAVDYGFILRYPKDKKSITEITYEPWHWRYVGVETAKAMNAGGQCLEEYLK